MYLGFKNFVIAITLGISCVGCSIDPASMDTPDQVGLQAKTELPVVGKLLGGVVQMEMTTAQCEDQFLSITAEPVIDAAVVEVDQEYYLRGQFSYRAIYLVLLHDPTNGNLKLNNEYKECTGKCNCNLVSKTSCGCDDPNSTDPCKYGTGDSKR